MICRVGRSELSGAVRCPPSKSYTHRALFLASLARGRSTVRNALRSEDTEATAAACRAFGAGVSWEGGAARVEGAGGASPADVYAANSGTTIRIAAAVAATARGPSRLSGDASLSRRPVGPLAAALRSLGARCSAPGGTPPLEVSGPMRGGAAEVPGGVSSQFVTALLIAGRATELGVEVSVPGGPVSADYVGYTEAAMAAFGARVESGPGRYSCAPGAYRPADVEMPADTSILALLLAASALTGGGLRAAAGGGGGLEEAGSALEAMAAAGVEARGGAELRASGRPRGAEVDLSASPDLLPAVAVLALDADGPVAVRGVGHARLKESDRVAALARELSKAGLRAEQSPGGLVLERRGPLRPAAFDAGGDHRMFMALCIAGMRIGGCTVTDPGSAAVSYPSFIEDMRRCGADLSVS